MNIPKPYKVASNGCCYVKVKVDGVFKKIRYSRWLWEQEYGPIPEGYQIHHKDHNPLNDVIENLEALPAFHHNSMHHKGLKTRLGAKLSDETKKKISDALKRRSAAKHQETNKSTDEGSTTNR